MAACWPFIRFRASSNFVLRAPSISKQGNSLARYLLTEAAQTAARYDEELRRNYRRLKFRRGSAVAKVAIAQKLAVRLYWILRNQSAPTVHMQGTSRKPAVGQRLAPRVRYS